MRRIALVIVLGLLTTGAAYADSAQGRWECVAFGAEPATDPNAAPKLDALGTPIEPPLTGISPDIPHGLLAIYGPSYTYVSAMANDPASGSGSIQLQETGVTFLDGPLVANTKVQQGLLGTGGGTPVMQLNGESGPVLTCTAR
ncbi:MAG TPA: hypothetical protein VGO70_10605 [Arsenicitalea sp.]|jgi:hypothetical protein|nr:hypothetical protein [Arsenicitalea sp.]